MKIKVEDTNNERIDSYLSGIEELELTRAKIQSLIKSNNILVNDKPIKNSYKVVLGDEIDINYVAEEMNVKAENIPLDIVYEDEDIIVINKPSGMVVHPSVGNTTGTLVNALMYYSKLSTINGDFRPGIVHRIDKDTSGLLVVAKNDKAHLFLSDELKDHKIKRKYIALVHGQIKFDKGTVDAPIGRDKNDRKKMAITTENAKEAITHFKVIDRYKNTTLIECELETGRTHQIRVHMKYINHPIVNDPVYSRDNNIDSFGQMLHAKELSFIHPKTKKEMTFSCEVPEEFNKILQIYKEE